jgi:hypothetical protein
MPRVAVGIGGPCPMPRVALGVWLTPWEGGDGAGARGGDGDLYAEGLVDAESSPRRSHLYADGIGTPTVVLRRCPGEAVRRRPR